MGGLAMIAVAVLYGMLSGYGPWLPVNLVGATLVSDLQDASLEVLAQFNAAALIVGFILLVALSAGLGLVFTLVLPTLPGSPVFWSLVVSGLLWWLAATATLPLFNPVLRAAVDGPSLSMAYLAYGWVLGGWVARTPRIRAE